MHLLLGFGISLNIFLYVLIANSALVFLGVVGFSNLRMQIRELKDLLSKMEEHKKELQG